jgi:4-oxalocrotonate tautomerase
MLIPSKNIACRVRCGLTEIDMPYVNIKITREGTTAEQKAALIQGVTQLLVDVLGKNPQTTMVVIDEVETDNWGIGGESVSVRRRRDSV